MLPITVVLSVCVAFLVVVLRLVFSAATEVTSTTEAQLLKTHATDVLIHQTILVGCDLLAHITVIWLEIVIEVLVLNFLTLAVFLI